MRRLFYDVRYNKKGKTLRTATKKATIENKLESILLDEADTSNVIRFPSQTLGLYRMTR